MKKYSKDGYKRNSKDRKNPYNIIPSGRITMKDVDFPVHGTDNLGNSQIMMPGGEYVFPGNEVFEVPLAQNGIELETQPVEINTEGLRRPLHVPGQPIVSDNLSENPMDQTPRNYVNDRIEYWEDPNSLAKNRMEGEYLDDNFIEPIGQTTDRVLEYVKDKSKTSYENDRKIFLKNLNNIAFLDMTDSQKYAQSLLEEFAINDENPFDMIDDPEEYGYKDLIELFKDRPDIKNIARMVMEDSEDSNYEISSSAVAMTADDEFLEKHKEEIDFYNFLNEEAIKEGRKEKIEYSYERGDLLEKEYIDTLLEDHGEDPNDPKWDKIRSFIIMNPDMHKISDDMSEDDYNTTLAHEIGHLERAEYLSDRDIYLLQTFNNTSDNLPEDKRTDHHTNTGEAYSDITAIRQDMLDKGIYDWRYEQMTNDHWQQYLSEYEEGNYPLVLQRTIDRYRVLPGEEEWDTHNKEQLKTKDQDTNIIYLNNNIADAEIGDDVDMGYAQEGGELKKFQPGGQVLSDGKFYSNKELGQMVNDGIIYSLGPGSLFELGYSFEFVNAPGVLNVQNQNEVPDPGAYPDVSIEETLIDPDKANEFQVQKKLIENKLILLNNELYNAQQTDLLDKSLTHKDILKSPNYDTSNPVDPSGGLGPNIVNIPDLEGLPQSKSELEIEIERQITLLNQEFETLLDTYIKPEYLLPPENPDSYYNEHYQKLVDYKIAQTKLNYKISGQPEPMNFDSAGNIIETYADPNQAVFKADTRTDQERKAYDDWKQNIYDNYEPHPHKVGYEIYNEWKKDPDWGWKNLGIDIHTQVRPKSTVHPSMYGYYSAAPGFVGALQSGDTGFMNDFHARRMNETQLLLLARVPIPGLNTMKIRNPWNLGIGPGANAHKYMTMPGIFDYGLKGFGIGLDKIRPGTTTGIKNVFNTGSWSGVYKPPHSNLTLQSQIKNPNFVTPSNPEGYQFSKLFTSTGDDAFKLNPNLNRPLNIHPDDWRFMNQQHFTPNAPYSGYSSPLKTNLISPKTNINTGPKTIGTEDLSTTPANLLTGPPAPTPVNYQTLSKGNEYFYDKGTLRPTSNQQTELDLGLPAISLQLKSLQNINKLDKGVKKDGTIGIDQIRGFANSVSTGDKIHIEKVLNSPKYKDLKFVNLQEFKNDVSASIIPLSHVISSSRNADGSIIPIRNQYDAKANRYAGHGLYDPRGGNVDPVVNTQPQVGIMNQDYYNDNITAFSVSLQNIDQLGAGSTHLNQISEKDLMDMPDAVQYDLAWFRGWNDKTLPQQFFLQEVQNNIGHNPGGRHDGEILDPLMNSRVDASNVEETYGLTMTNYARQLEIAEKQLAAVQKRVDSGYMNGKLMNDWELQAQQDVLKNNQTAVEYWNDRISNLEASYQNYDIKDNLLRGNNGKNMLRRTLAESVIFAANNGNLVYNFPTVETYAKLAGKPMDLKDLSDFKLYNESISQSYDDIHNRIAHGFTREAHITNTIENSRGVVHSMQLRPEYTEIAPNGNTVMSQSANEDMFAIRDQRDLEALSIIESRGLGWRGGEYYDQTMDKAVSVDNAWMHLNNVKDIRLSRSDERKLFDIRYEMYETDPTVFSNLKEYESIPAGLTKREIKKNYYDQFVYGPKLGTQFTNSSDRLLKINGEVDKKVATLNDLNSELRNILDEAGLSGIYKGTGDRSGYVTKEDYTSFDGRNIPQSTIELSMKVADQVDPLIKQINDLNYEHSDLLREKKIMYDNVEALNRLSRMNNNYIDKFNGNFNHYQNETELLVSNVSKKYNKQLYSFYQPMDVVIPNTAQTNTYNLNWDEASNTWGDATVHSYDELHRGPGTETETALRNYYGLVKEISVNPMNPKSYRKEDIAMLSNVQNYAREFKAIFGKDLEIIPVTGPNGFTYYQFKIPESVLNGSFILAPNKKYGGQIYQNGGESYIQGSSEDPNIYPDQEFNWYNPLDWYRSYTSIDPEEVLANARDEGYEAWYSVLPKHLQNTNYYDLEGAYEAGLDPVWSEDHNEYHLGSRDPRTGRLFKYEDHPTFNKLVQGETDEGNVIWYDSSGDMYSGKEVPEDMYEFEEYSDQYLAEYLQFVENSLKTGFDPVTGLWQPYRGVNSKGKKEKFHTIGYGHQLSKEEYKLYKKGISQEKVDELLQKDITEAQRKLDIRYGKDQWYRDLHPREKAILLDIEYNVKGGMNAFPKLLEAIQTGNKTLLLTEFWRDLPEGKDNVRNQEFKRKFIIPVSNMYKYNKRQLGGEIKKEEQEKPVWDKRRSRLKQQLKVYQQGGEISPFAREELMNLGLINPQDDLSMPVDNTAVATNEINFSLLDPEMNLTPKSDNEEEFGEMNLTGSIRSNQNDDDEEDDIEDEEDETNDDEDAGDDAEDSDNEEDDNEEDEDSEDDEEEEDDDEEDDDEDDDEHFTPEPVEVDSYASGRGSQYERMKPSDDTWTGSPNRVPQPMQIPPTRVKPGQIREYQTPIPRDFTSQMLAAEFARANYGEQQQPLTFDYLQRTYGDFNPARQQMQQQARYGGSLPRVQEGGTPWWDQAANYANSKIDQAKGWVGDEVINPVKDEFNEAVDLEGWRAGEQGMIPDFYGQDTYGMTEDWREGLDEFAEKDFATPFGKMASFMSNQVLGNAQAAHQLSQIDYMNQPVEETFSQLGDVQDHITEANLKTGKKLFTPPPVKFAQVLSKESGLDKPIADAWNSGTEYVGDQIASVTNTLQDHYLPSEDQPLIAENQDDKGTFWSRMSDATAAADTTAPTDDVTAPTTEEKEIPTAQGGGEQLPNVIINEGSPQLYDHMDNTIYVHPEDVEGPEVPYVSEHEPDHVLRHELEHYYQWQDLKDEEWPNMAPTADGEYDIITNTSWYPHRQDNPMSQRLEDDREMVMRDMYLQVLDPDGTNFWLQNMDIEDLMDELALDNEAIYQLERQVMKYPINIRDYMLERIRGERAERLYLQATEEVYNDPRTLEGQARMIEDDGRQDAHIIETLKHQAIKNKEEGISDHPYIKKEMKTLQKNQKGGESKKKSKYATEVDEFNKLNQGYLLGETAYNMFINEEDTSRPPAGKKEKIISSILPFKNCWYNNACVQTVKDIFNNAGIDSGIPDDVYDNLTFLKNYKDYGFELIDNASEEDMRMGDIIQFNYTEEEYPYHMGMYIADDQYISDGEHDKPIQKKSVSGKGAYKIFRKV